MTTTEEEFWSILEETRGPSWIMINECIRFRGPEQRLKDSPCPVCKVAQIKTGECWISNFDSAGKRIGLPLRFVADVASDADNGQNSEEVAAIRKRLLSLRGN